METYDDRSGQELFGIIKPNILCDAGWKWGWWGPRKTALMRIRQNTQLVQAYGTTYEVPRIQLLKTTSLRSFRISLTATFQTTEIIY